MRNHYEHEGYIEKRGKMITQKYVNNKNVAKAILVFPKNR